MTLYDQRCESDPAYPLKRHAFSPEIEYMYYDAQRKGHFGNVDPAEILVEATKTSADENRSAAEACRSLVPRLRQEYMRHVSFRHFQGSLMNDEQVAAANFAIAQLAQQIENEGQRAPTFEECMKFTAEKHKTAIEEKELLHAARQAPPKRRAPVPSFVEGEAVESLNLLAGADPAAKRGKTSSSSSSSSDTAMDTTTAP